MAMLNNQMVTLTLTLPNHQPPIDHGTSDPFFLFFHPVSTCTLATRQSSAGQSNSWGVLRPGAPLNFTYQLLGYLGSQKRVDPNQHFINRLTHGECHRKMMGVFTANMGIFHQHLVRQQDIVGYIELSMTWTLVFFSFVSRSIFGCPVWHITYGGIS